MKSKNISVIGGGGINGAYTAGRLYTLKKKYDGGVGVSTGALAILYAILGLFEKLRDAYFVSMNDIFKISPFNKKGKIRKLNLIWRSLTGKKSIGDSSNLKDHIDKFITKSEYVEASKFEIKLGVHSITKNENVFISNKNVGFESFKKWMHISANAPLLMNIEDFKRPNSDVLEQFCDGGVTEGVPVVEGCRMAGAGGTVDVFLHVPKKIEAKDIRIKNVFQLLTWFVKTLFRDSGKNDIEMGKMAAELIGCKLNLYYMPIQYYPNPFNINKDKTYDLFNKGCKNPLEGLETHDFRR